MIKNINISELKHLLSDKELIILDVRDKEDFPKRRINKAINIEIEEINNIIKICPDKNKKILVYCARGVRSIVAAEILEELGYKEVYNLKGGIEKISK